MDKSSLNCQPVSDIFLSLLFSLKLFYLLPFLVDSPKSMWCTLIDFINHINVSLRYAD